MRTQNTFLYRLSIKIRCRQLSAYVTDLFLAIYFKTRLEQDEDQKKKKISTVLNLQMAFENFPKMLKSPKTTIYSSPLKMIKCIY